MTALGVTGSHWFVIPLTLLITLVTAIMPVFYFALYRNEGTVQVSRPLRKLALAAAAAYVIVMVLRVQALPNRLSWFGVFGLLGNLAYILLLVSMSREASEDPIEQVPVSDLLAAVTKVAVVAWGIWVAFQLVRLAIVIFTYSSFENYANRIGRTPPTLRDMMLEVILTFFSQGSLLAAPYIVWRSALGRGTSPRESLQSSVEEGDS